MLVAGGLQDSLGAVPVKLDMEDDNRQDQAGRPREWILRRCADFGFCFLGWNFSLRIVSKKVRKDCRKAIDDLQAVRCRVHSVFHSVFIPLFTPTFHCNPSCVFQSVS